MQRIVLLTPSTIFSRRQYLLFLFLLSFQLVCIWSAYFGLNNPITTVIILCLSSVLVILLTLNFQLAACLFILSFLSTQDLTTTLRIRVADLITVVLILSFVVRYLNRGAILLARTSIDKIVLLFMVILGLSLINTKSMEFGVINYLRHIQLFLVMYTLFYCLDFKQFKKLLYLFLIAVVCNALYSNFLYISVGGGIRSFGAGGNEFTDMVVPASLILYVFFFFEEKQIMKLFFAAGIFTLLFALFATGTRGALLSWAIGFIITNIVLLKQNRISKTKALKLGFLTLVFIGVLALIFEYQTTHGVVSPYVGYLDTIDFRFALWALALKSFLTHPMLGIGLNQFMKIEEVFPTLKFSVFFPYIKGLDAHSVVLNFLANTGILGTGTLLFLFYMILKLSWKLYKESINTLVEKISLALALVLTYVVYSSFYAGSWFWSLNGFEFMFFLAMMLRIRQELAMKIL